MFRILLASLALSVCLAFTASAQGATYYVSPGGTSENLGTQASPWSLGKANSDLVAGDTVILMDGSYITQIDPSQSGTAGNRITYRAQNSRMAILAATNPRIEMSGRHYITLDGIKASDGRRWAIANFASNITINDCEFVDFSSGSYETGKFRGSGGNLHITNSRFDNHIDGIHIRDGQGHHIANNQILEDYHSPLVLMGISNSVIENNYFSNPDQRNIEVLSVRQAMPPNERRTNYIVIQDNYFHSFNQTGGNPSAIKQSGSFSILRRNVFDDCSVSGIRLAQAFGSQLSYRPEGWFCEKNRIYNNTFYGCLKSIQVSKSNSTIAAGGAYGDNICMNNIIFAGTDSRQIELLGDAMPNDVSFFYNSIMRSSPGELVFYAKGGKTVAEIESSYPTHYMNNFEFDPMFTDAAADDFTLAPDSDAIDAGGNLTTTIGSGAGTVVAVADSLFFTDGYGVTDPDTIRIGDDRVQIVSIDRATHVITVDSSISWSNGDPISLDYYGTAPDLGAFESGDPPGAIEARLVFYNNSAWDGNDPAENASDDAAIATNKSALLPGEIASFANYTSYWRGINGVMIDIDIIPAVPNASDFAFRIGNDSNPGLWVPLAVTPSVTVRPGAGTNGSNRITIILPDGTAAGKWLEVAFKATANTGLLKDDIFYFGNAIGETGNSVTDAQVTQTDEVYTHDNPATLAVSSASIMHAGDFNRDKKVGPTDSIIARNNGTNSSTALKLITVP